MVNEHDQSWREQALCAQVDPEAFFPDQGYHPSAAKRICGMCPVRAECLEYALENNERYGIWGGYTAWERRALRPSAQHLTAGAA